MKHLSLCSVASVAFLIILFALICTCSAWHASSAAADSYLAAVVRLWPISGATPGGTVKLWAQVGNLSSTALPSDAKVAFWVDGPNWVGTHWVGSTSTAALPAGTEQWFSCSWTIPSNASAGTYKYWAQVWTTSAISAWSVEQGFVVSQSGIPGKATLTFPSGTISSTTPTYTWMAVPSATWYYLWVVDSTASSGRIKAWYSAAQAGCASGTGTCSATPSIALSAGSAQWWIQTWSDQGYGPWSDGMNFVISAPKVQILALQPVTNAKIDANTQLWAQVKNIGDTPLPSGSVVSFWVSDMLRPWVGSTDIGGLLPGQTRWYSLDWQVSVEILSAAHTYKAQAFAQTANGLQEISKLSAGVDLIVSGIGTALVAHINKVLEVSDAPTGGQALLQAEIYNIGGYEFSINTNVRFYIHGLSDPWVGSTSIWGQIPGATASYAIAWEVPASIEPGTYTYQARAFGPSKYISDWSPEQKFTIYRPSAVAAQVLGVERVTDAAVGTTAAFAAQVRNIGSQALPADAQVWFWVGGGNLTDHWVGSVSIANMAVSDTRWYRFSWAIPKTIQAGEYSYRAQVWSGDKAISGFGPSRTFTVKSDLESGFDEPFIDGTAPNWIRDFGAWDISNGFYTGRALPKSVVTSTFNAIYDDFDFSARVIRTAADRSSPSFLEVRATGEATGMEHNLQNGYRLQYNNGGMFSIVKVINGFPSFVQDWTFTSVLVQGQNLNTLRVKAIANRFWFYINDALVWTGTVGSVTGGRVGFGFYSSDGADTDLFCIDWAKLSVSPQF